MGQRYPHPIRGSNEPGVDLCIYSFLCNAAADPANTGLTGAGLPKSGVVHAATGKYTMTLDCNWVRVDGLDPELEADATGDGGYATANVVLTGTTAVITVFTHDKAGTLTDFTDRRVWVGVKGKASVVNTSG